MAIRYDKLSQSTSYGGVVFRSKLEALWARQFDRAGIKWRYEPFMIGDWLPDFVLDFTDKDDCWVFVCEVKPFTKYLEWLYHKEKRYWDHVENLGFIDPKKIPDTADFSWCDDGPPSCFRMCFLGMTPESCDMSDPCVLFGDGMCMKDTYAEAPYFVRAYEVK